MANATTLHQDAARLAETLSGWRRSLHRRPELGFEEVDTAAFVEARLREIGVEEIRTGIARTGLIGILRAGKGKSSDRQAVLLRSDMDALPIHETEGREYGSQIPGKMHACGHDGHMAMLLGAATLLVARQNELTRDVVLCFQPAEEGAGGGREMVEEGVLEIVPVEEAYAIHLWSQYRVGTVHVRSGPIMAAQDEFTARIQGQGGHGAAPHGARDPILAASLGVVAAQSVVSRSIDPMEPAVVSVGAIHSGSAGNVIPDHAVLEGTLRSFTPEVRLLLRERLDEALAGAAQAAGCRAELEIRPGYPAVVNDPVAAETVRKVATGLFGTEEVFETPPLAASEDFAYFLEKTPGAFMLLGAGNEDMGITAPHHSPEFDIDEAALPRGAAMLAALALQ